MNTREAPYSATSWDELEALIVKGMRHPKEEHHPNCRLRRSGVRGCDCYYRFSATSHEALNELIERAKNPVARHDDGTLITPEDTDSGWAVQ